MLVAESCAAQLFAALHVLIHPFSNSDVADFGDSPLLGSWAAADLKPFNCRKAGEQRKLLNLCQGISAIHLQEAPADMVAPNIIQHL